MSYTRRRPPPRPHNAGRYTAEARAAAAVIRAQAEQGRPCWFWGMPGYEDCPRWWDWTLPYHHRWAYTVHHLDRLMDGGHPAPDPSRMAPAHRSCNARDGLTAQNARRYGTPTTPTPGTVVPTTGPDRTSRQW